MSLVKYKVTGSFLDRTYYSNDFDIDPSEFENEDDIKDYLRLLTIECQFDIPYQWLPEGSEDRGGGFRIESIKKYEFD